MTQTDCACVSRSLDLLTGRTLTIMMTVVQILCTYLFTRDGRHNNEKSVVTENRYKSRSEASQQLAGER